MNLKAAAFEVIEALESEPHVGMDRNPALWKAYVKLAKAAGAKPMKKWWERPKDSTC